MQSGLEENWQRRQMYCIWEWKLTVGRWTFSGRNTDTGRCPVLCKEEQSNIGTVLTTIVRHSENLDYIVPMPVSEDIKEIDSEEWIRLIQKIIEQSIYEIVILDMDEGVRDIYRVLRICNEIHMLTIDEPVAEAKVAQFEAELELLGYEDVRRKIIRKKQRT